MEQYQKETLDWLENTLALCTEPGWESRGDRMDPGAI